MAKYDEQYKLHVIERYRSDQHGGLKAVAAFFGLHHSQVRYWVAQYELHGCAGLRPKRSVYDVHFKRRVLEHMRSAGLSCQHAAALFDIRSASQLGAWKRQYDNGGVDALASRRQGRCQKMPNSLPLTPSAPPISDESRSREELLKELEYLRAENAYLKKLDALIRAKQQAAQKKRK